MKVLSDRKENGQTFFNILRMENDCFIYDFRTVDQVQNREILSEYYKNQKQSQNQGDNLIYCPKSEEINQINKEDHFFFSQFSNSDVDFSADLNIESVFPVIASNIDVKLMIPQENDVLFVDPEYIEQVHNEKCKMIYDKLIESSQNIESNSYF